MPNPIRVDTRPPKLTLLSAAPLRISPDRDRRRDFVRFTYRLDERAKAHLFVNGRRHTLTRFQPLEGKVDWNGRLNGRPVRPGRYELVLAAVDPAGNRTDAPARTAVVRYIQLARESVRARVRTRFGVRVLADARTYRWRFARASGVARPGLLVLFAPRRPGRYTLYVSANGRADKATVRVVPRPRPPRRAG
jgi:hypothetical protein